MRMARASTQDLEITNQIAGALDQLIDGYVPECASTSEDDFEWLDVDNAEQCQQVLLKLIDIAKGGSMMRATFGMAILLDPRNEILDPNSDCLDLHPKLRGLLNNLAPTP
jgi:hypothetical protein